MSMPASIRTGAGSGKLLINETNPADGESQMSQAARPLRADAQRNQHRLLNAAAAAFTRDGAAASLKDIAGEAGVGIGTLYRRFPTRELLVEATYRNELTRLCASAGRSHGHTSPRTALRRWMDRFIAFMATKHAMASALRNVLADDDDRLRTRAELAEAIDHLLAAGRADGTLRDDVPAMDVLMALGGVCLIAGEPDQGALAGRLLDLLLDGLTAPPTRP
jgi:AcrR family transcriptional regulator